MILPDDVTFDRPGNLLLTTIRHGSMSPARNAARMRGAALTRCTYLLICPGICALRPKERQCADYASCVDGKGGWLLVDWYIGGTSRSAILYLLGPRASSPRHEDYRPPERGRGAVPGFRSRRARRWVVRNLSPGGGANGVHVTPGRGGQGSRRSDGVRRVHASMAARGCRDRPDREDVEVEEERSRSGRHRAAELRCRHGAPVHAVGSAARPRRDLTEAGVEGAYRFVQRLWRLDPGGGAASGRRHSGSRDLRRGRRRVEVAHKALKAVGEEVGRLGFNKAARLYELVNAPGRWRAIVSGSRWKACRALRQAVEFLIVMVAPMMPYLAEECWATLGNKGFADAAGPGLTFDLALL